MRKGRLVLVSGVPCSGKTTLSKKIVQNNRTLLGTGLDYTYLDKDVIQDCFTKEREGKYYDEIKNETYKVMFEVAKSNVDLGNCVLLDAPFVKQLQDQNWVSDIKRISNNTKVVWCYAEEEDIRQRLMQRGEIRDYKKLVEWQKWKKEEPITIEIKELPYIEVNTSFEYSVRDIIKFLR